MANNNYKHYVTEAFRFYALCGMPTENQLRALKGTFPNKFRGSLADIEAVIRTLGIIQVMEPDEADTWITVLEDVYFADPQHVPSRGEVTRRVSLVAHKLGISESTIYRILRKESEICAQQRQLRCDESCAARIRNEITQMKYGGNKNA